MLTLWLQDIESLEAISQDDQTKQIFLRMATLSQTGGIPQFLAELEHDEDIDETTKATLSELANEPSFLLAVEDYLRSTQRIH